MSLTKNDQEVSNRYSIESAISKVKEETSELEDKVKEENDEIVIQNRNVDYSSQEDQQLAEQVYNSKIMDNGESEKKNDPLETEYMTATNVQKTESETMDNKEAAETMRIIEAGSMFGDRYGAGSEKMRRLDMLAKIEPAFFALQMSFSMTRDVNYRPL